MTERGILSTVDSHRLFAALGEPNRLRIVELLAAAPRTVGEIAQALDIRQPQTTKHLQTLEASGLVVVHRLGKRRVASLERSAVRELAGFLSLLGVASPSEDVLDQYERALRAEEQRDERSGQPDLRTFRIEHAVAAPLSEVWSSVTTAEQAQKWWSPQHFEVASCIVEPVVGGRMQVTIREGDGAEYSSTGEVLGVRPGHGLVFTQAPVDEGGEPMFAAVHELELREADGRTLVSLTIRVKDGTSAPAEVLAGIPIGWEQCLDKLAEVVESA